MIRLLTVVVAHGLDLVTFGLVVARYGIGVESNPIARLIVAVAGMAGLVAVKAAGAVGLGLLAEHRPWMVVPAAGMGLLGFWTGLHALGIVG